jgi:hypothetical protein
MHMIDRLMAPVVGVRLHRDSPFSNQRHS